MANNIITEINNTNTDNFQSHFDLYVFYLSPFEQDLRTIHFVLHLINFQKEWFLLYC